MSGQARMCSLTRSLLLQFVGFSLGCMGVGAAWVLLVGVADVWAWPGGHAVTPGSLLLGLVGFG